MPSSPMVDVGIPTLGVSPYLREAIESVLAQTLTSWRLVISENGPGAEAVRHVLEPYIRDPRIEHVTTGETVSQGANHTRALAGRAPYVALLHDDDRWRPHFLERSVDFLEARPGCGLVFCGHVLIDEQGAPTGRSRPRLHEGVHPPAKVLPLLYDENFIAPPCVVMRRSAYEAVGAVFKEVFFSDHEMWLRLAAHFDVGCRHAWDAEYRLHTSQISSTRRLELAERQFEVIEATRDLPIPPRVRRRTLAKAHLRCALDDIELSHRRKAISHLADAVRADPLSLVRLSHGGRLLIALGALLAGPPGQRALTRARLRRYARRGSEPVS
ncbi:MAG TPA: glycosyltransferase [Gaiellaceae bacterium]|nr:glycosyltransferase [Gaiellaceae bacterium]